VELELERQKAEDVGGQVTVGVESPVYDVYGVEATHI
jgi:hypothetical protein